MCKYLLEFKEELRNYTNALGIWITDGNVHVSLQG